MKMEFANECAVSVGLMVVSVENSPLNATQQITRRLISGELKPNGQEIDAVADESAVFQQRLAGSRNADHDISLRGKAVQERGKSCEQRREKRAALFRASLFDLVVSRGVDADAMRC